MTAADVAAQPLTDQTGDRLRCQDHHVMVIACTCRNRALCSCRWLGRRRLMLSVAKVDALIHSAETGHLPTIPLVVRMAN
jgi:hypothetical protein